jgi:hypothetical protein
MCPTCNRPTEVIIIRNDLFTTKKEPIGEILYRKLTVCPIDPEHAFELSIPYPKSFFDKPH